MINKIGYFLGALAGTTVVIGGAVLILEKIFVTTYQICGIVDQSGGPKKKGK